MVEKKKGTKDAFDAMSLEALDEWYENHLKKYETEDGHLDFGDDPNGDFYAKIEAYERYLDARNKLLARRPLETKQIVVDKDAVDSTLKTYDDINKRIQRAIADGQTLDGNDIKLLIEMMKVLNGDK